MSVPIIDGFNPPVHKTHHGADTPPAFLPADFLQIDKLAIAFSQKLRYFKDVEKLRGGRIDTRRESAAVWQRFSCISWGRLPPL